MAYYSIDPFGEKRQDIRFAMLSCLVANMVRGKDQSAYKMQDFLLDFEPKEKESDEIIAVKINMHMKALQG